MQLTVIGLAIPWLILLSQTPFYGYVRIIGALLAGMAALAWMVERVTEQSNVITGWLETQRPNAVWLLVVLAAFALWGYWKTRLSASFTTSDARVL